MEETLKRLITEHGLEDISNRLLEMAAVASQIIKEPNRACAIGGSRIGGLPDAPAGFVWPTRDGRPLSLLAQINCAEVALHAGEQSLPKAGILHFFYDIQEEPWGFDPVDKDGAVVIYNPEGALQELPAPSGLDEDAIRPTVPITFRRFLSIPSAYSEEGCSLNLSDSDADSYGELYRAIWSVGSEDQPKHQLLGKPDNVQGDMNLECQLVSNGIWCGNPSGYADPRAQTLTPGASEWRLLLQIDSDDDWMWGDSGMVYFWIRDSDLRENEFNKTWTILQCC